MAIVRHASSLARTQFPNALLNSARLENPVDPSNCNYSVSPGEFEGFEKMLKLEYISRIRERGMGVGGPRLPPHFNDIRITRFTS